MLYMTKGSTLPTKYIMHPITKKVLKLPPKTFAALAYNFEETMPPLTRPKKTTRERTGVDGEQILSEV